jgi:hypothetical protein
LACIPKGLVPFPQGLAAFRFPLTVNFLPHCLKGRFVFPGAHFSGSGLFACALQGSHGFRFAFPKNIDEALEEKAVENGQKEENDDDGGDTLEEETPQLT